MSNPDDAPLTKERVLGWIEACGEPGKDDYAPGALADAVQDACAHDTIKYACRECIETLLATVVKRVREREQFAAPLLDEAVHNLFNIAACIARGHFEDSGTGDNVFNNIFKFTEKVRKGKA